MKIFLYHLFIIQITSLNNKNQGRKTKIQKKSSKIEAYINFHKYIHLGTYNDEKKYKSYRIIW